MSLSVNPAASYATTFGTRNINPSKDKVYVDPQTGELTTWKPGIYDPEAQEKTKKRKKTLLTALALCATAAAVWFFTKGKGRPYAEKVINKVKPYFQGMVDKVKSFFGKGKKAATSAADAAAPKPATPKKPVDEVIRNVDTKAVDAKSRKLVEQAIADTPTAAQQKAYDRSIAYVAPTAEEKAVIKQVNAEANRASAISRQIQNNTSEASLEALNKAKAGMTEANTALNGVFNNGSAEFTLKNGKIVGIKAADGRVITDAKKIAKYEFKHGVNLAELKSGAMPLSQTQKQLEIQQAWAEFDRARAVKPAAVETKVPTSDEIWAMYEQGKLA